MDVAGWLRDQGLEQYVESFEANAIDAQTLALLSDDDLKELGVRALGHRRKILAAIGDVSAIWPAEPAAAEAATSAPSSEGERRQVTVLFADISGFTKLSAGLDPEETRDLLNGFFAVVDRVVQGFGGTIDKHIGDAVMAVFGAPIAHSNDAERAVRAALEIHRAVIDVVPAIKVHIGIASGQVIASGMGSEEHREYTVTGDSVNLASRLEDLAGPDETYLSNAVYQALAPQLRCEAIGEVEIQGLETAVKTWRLIAFQSDGNGSTGHAFVGRGRELRQFGGAVEDCRETGYGQTLYIRGEAGIGKSRLAEEFENIARRAGFDCHTGLVMDFGVGTGQDAIRALVRSLLGLTQASMPSDVAPPPRILSATVCWRRSGGSI